MMVAEKQYLFAGQLFAMTVLQGGPYPDVLCEWCYSIISSSKSVDPMQFDLTKEFLNEPSVKKVKGVN